MEGNKSLFKICQDAINQAIAESCVGDIGFLVSDAVKIAKQNTHEYDYTKAELLEKVIRQYVAIAAAMIGYRSGRKGEGAYFDEETMNRSVASQLVINAKDDAKAHAAKADNLSEQFETRFSTKAVIDGQLTMDFALNTVFEEMTVDRLIDFMKEASGEN